MKLVVLAALLVVAVSAPPASAQAMKPATGLGQVQPVASNMRPEALTNAGFDQRLGESLPFDARFLDETGKSVTLGDYFDGRPVVLVPVYFKCPMLCKLVMNEVAQSFADVPLTPGKDFQVVVFSFDKSDTPALAAEKKAEALRRYSRPDTEAGWHFLTGTEAEILKLSEAIGFRFKWDERTGEFAHASGLVVATPEGKLSRYFYGFDYPAKTLRLTLVEASEEKIGSLTDHVLLFCFKYDPTTGKYSAITMNLVRLCGALTVVSLALYIGFALRRDRMRSQRSLGTA